MKSIVSLLATVAIFFVTSVSSPAKLPAKATDFQGAITAVTETSVTVKNPKGTRVFEIYPGTVFGQRAKGKFSDLKPGENVIVVFSEAGGKAKAENIRNPADDKKKPVAKAKGKGAKKPK